jgi:hypothetical protein
VWMRKVSAASSAARSKFGSAAEDLSPGRDKHRPSVPKLRSALFLPGHRESRRSWVLPSTEARTAEAKIPYALYGNYDKYSAVITNRIELVARR